MADWPMKYVMGTFNYVWGSEQQEEQRHQVTNHTYLVGEGRLSYTPCREWFTWKKKLSYVLTEDIPFPPFSHNRLCWHFSSRMA